MTTMTTTTTTMTMTMMTLTTTTMTTTTRQWQLRRRQRWRRQIVFCYRYCCVCWIPYKFSRKMPKMYVLLVQFHGEKGFWKTTNAVENIDNAERPLKVNVQSTKFCNGSIMTTCFCGILYVLADAALLHRYLFFSLLGRRAVRPVYSAISAINGKLKMRSVFDK